MLGGVRSTTEQAVYISLAALLALAQILGLALHAGAADYLRVPATSLLRYRFGFDQLRHLGVAPALCCYALLAVLLIAFHRNKASWLANAKQLGRFMTSPLGTHAWLLVCMGLFFVLRNEFVNQDGRAFAARFLAAVPTKGAHVTHDEMWEFYLHSRFWLWTTMRYGWSVIQSYQFLSVVAGGVFVVLLIRTCALLLPGKSVVLFMAITSGGFMQLFFGDVENYTLTAALILLYLLSAFLYLQGKLPLAGPSAALAVAITFHLLAGFLLPSLAYLYWGHVRGHGWRGVGLALTAFAGIILATLVFFAFHNLPITDLFYKSHAFGHGGHILLMLARPSALYYWQQFNLLALLFPGFILILPLLAFKRIPWDPTNIFLAIASFSLLTFQLSWNAQLGVYNDWNLFAAGAIPFSLLVWRNVLSSVSFPLKAEAVAAVIALAGIHSLAWIISNRFFGFL